MAVRMTELTEPSTLARFLQEVDNQGDPPLDCYLFDMDFVKNRTLLNWCGPFDSKSYLGNQDYDCEPVSLLFGSRLSEHKVPLAGIDREKAVYALMAKLTKRTLRRRLVVEGEEGFLILAIGAVGVLEGYISEEQLCEDWETILSFAFLEKHGCPFDYDRYGWGSGRQS